MSLTIQYTQTGHTHKIAIQPTAFPQLTVRSAQINRPGRKLRPDTSGHAQKLK